MAALSSFFLDTTILLGGLIEFPTTDHCQRILDAVVKGGVKEVHSSWHCCLEFYSVSTRLPEEYRLTPDSAMLLIEKEILSRLQIHQLPGDSRREFFPSAAADRIVGGRIYDRHIAEVALGTGCRILVTENQRHFRSLLRHGLSVLNAEELTSKLDL